MPLDSHTLQTIAERFLGAWNSQDVEAVLACYTEDVVYRDPNTRGEVRGREAMRHYLRKLFGSWTMRWSTREAYSLQGGDGAALLWRASFRQGDSPVVEADGMDLVVMRGHEIARNEVYFDRSVLAPLMGSRT